MREFDVLLLPRAALIRARRLHHVTQDEVFQPGLELDPHQFRRLHNGLPQLVARHRGEDELVAGHGLGEDRLDLALVEEVRAHGNDDAQPPARERVHQLADEAALRLIAVQREKLLELVDDDQEAFGGRVAFDGLRD